LRFLIKTLIKYITHTCRYEEIESKECKSSASCNNNLECLSNKCFNNYCVFNEETPIVHCDDIYSNILFKSSYMHCGKPYNDVCSSNDECSSKQCIHGTYDIQENGPSDSESTGLNEGIKGLVLILIIIILISICYCCCCYKKNIK